MSTYPYTIEFQGEYNQNYDVITAVSFDGSFSQDTSFLTTEPIYTERPNGTRISYGAKYTEVAEPIINLVKKDYSNFSRAEIRDILRWLTSTKNNSWLKLYDEDGEPICEYYGRFTVVEEQIADSRVLGFTCTFTSTHPYAFSPIRDIQQTFTGSETIVLENDSDVLDDTVKPYLTITLLNTNLSKLSITNTETNITTFIKNIKQDEILTIDNENKLVYSNDIYRIIGSDFYGDVNGFVTNYPVWLELVPGDNKIVINTGSSTAQVEYTLKYRYPMKLGSTF